jgi:hypothetical protein
MSQCILQVDSVVVTYKSDYEFLGDIKTLPTPIRITLGDPIESLFQSQKLRLEDAAPGAHNIKKLMRDKTGCLITTSLKAMTWLENPKYQNNMDVSTITVVSRSYFLTFSKKSSLGQEKMKGRMYSLGEVNFIQGMHDIGNCKNSVVIPGKVNHKICGYCMPHIILWLVIFPPKFEFGRKDDQYMIINNCCHLIIAL